MTTSPWAMPDTAPALTPSEEDVEKLFADKFSHPTIEAYVSGMVEANAVLRKTETALMSSMIEAANRGEIPQKDVQHIITCTHTWLAAIALEIPLSATYLTLPKLVSGILPCEEVLAVLFDQELPRLKRLTIDMISKRVKEALSGR